MSWRDINAQLAAFGPPPEAEQSPFRKYVQKTIFSVFGLTQGAVPALFGGTDIYKQAQEENLQRFGPGAGTLETLPGAGDIAVQLLPQAVRESTLGGRIGEPVLRMIGNIAADPTNWIGGALIKNAAKYAMTSGALEAGKAAMAARGLEELAPVISGLQSTDRLAKIRATKALVQASGDAKAIKTYDLLSKAGLGTDISIMAAATAAAGPDLVTGAYQAGKQAVEDIQQREYGKAGADLATTTLMGGLAALVGKGALDARRAAKTFIEHTATVKPELASGLAEEAARTAMAEAGPVPVEAAPGPPAPEVPPPAPPPTAAVPAMPPAPPPARPVGQMPLFPGEPLPTAPRTAPIAPPSRVRRPVIGEQLPLEFMWPPHQLLDVDLGGGVGKGRLLARDLGLTKKQLEAGQPKLRKSDYVREQMKLATEDIDRKMDEMGSAGLLRTPREAARVRGGYTIAGTKVSDRFEYEDFFDAYESGRLEPNGEYVFNKAKYERWKKKAKAQIGREFDDMVRPPEPEVGKVSPAVEVPEVRPTPEVPEPAPVVAAEPVPPVEAAPRVVTPEPPTKVPPAEAAPPEAPVPAAEVPTVEALKAEKRKLSREEMDAMLVEGNPSRIFLDQFFDQYGVKKREDLDKVGEVLKKEGDTLLEDTPSRQLAHYALGGRLKREREASEARARVDMLAEREDIKAKTGGKVAFSAGEIRIRPIKSLEEIKAGEAQWGQAKDPAEMAVEVWVRQLATESGQLRSKKGRSLFGDAWGMNEAFIRTWPDPEWMRIAREGPLDKVVGEGPNKDQRYSGEAVRRLQAQYNLLKKETETVKAGEAVAGRPRYQRPGVEAPSGRIESTARYEVEKIPEDTAARLGAGSRVPRIPAAMTGDLATQLPEVSAAQERALAAVAPELVDKLELVQERVKELSPGKGDEESLFTFLRGLNDDVIRSRAIYKKTYPPGRDTQINRLVSLFKAYRKAGTELSHEQMLAGMEEAAAQGGWNLGRMGDADTTRLNKVFESVISLPVFEGGKIGVSDAARLAQRNAVRKLAESRSAAEAELGIQKVPGIKDIGYVPGARKGREATGITYRILGDNEVRLDVASRDAPVDPTMRVEGRQLVLSEGGWTHWNTEHLQITNLGGKENRTVDDVAEVLRAVIKGNPSLRFVEIHPQMESSDLVRGAFKKLKDEGLISPKEKVVVTVRGKAAAPTLVGGGARPGAVAGWANSKENQQLLELRTFVSRSRWLAKNAPGVEAGERASLLEAAAQKEAEANKLWEQLKPKAGAEAEGLNTYLNHLAEVDASEKYVQNFLDRGGIRHPVGLVYEVNQHGVVKPIKLAEWVHVADPPPEVARARAADTLDRIANAIEVDGVRIPNIDGVYDPDALALHARAVKPIYAKLEEISNEITKLVGLAGLRFHGVSASPWSHEVVVWEGKEGHLFLSPQGAYWRANGDPRRAARLLVAEQIDHAILHVWDDSIEHGGGSVQRLKEIVAAVEARRKQLIDELGDPALWTGVRDAHPNYLTEVQRIIDGKRQAWARTEAGVGGVRPRSVGSRIATLSYRPAEAAVGAEAGGGARLRPGALVPEGAGGEAGGLGSAAPGGRAAEGGPGGGTPGEVPGRGPKGQGKLAFSRPPTGAGTVAEARAAIDDLINRRGDTPEIQQDAVLLSEALMRKLKENLGTPAVRDEWIARRDAKPTGSGPEWARINLALTQASEDAKVMFQIYSEVSKRHPELRKLYDVHKRMELADLNEHARAILGVYTPEQLQRKWNKGLRLTYAEQQALRIIATDTVNNWDVASKEYERLINEYALMSAGPAKEAFLADKVLPAQERLDVAGSHWNRVDTAINLGTEAGRSLAAHKVFRLTSDPNQQRLNALKEGLREFLGRRYRNKIELEEVLARLMQSYQAKRNDPSWSSTGMLDWYHELQKAYKFGAVDKYLQFYKAGLLGWTSRVANLGSNAIFVNGLRKAENDLAAALEQGYAKLTGKKPERFASEILLSRMIAQRGLREAGPAWWRAQRSAFALKPLDYSQSRDFVDDLIRMPSAISGKLGEFISFMFKGMNSDDAFFKHLVKVDHYYRQVYRNVMNKVEGFEMRPGETSLQATERLVGDLTQNIADMYDRGQKMDRRFEDIHNAAQKLAQRDTYQEALPGVIKSVQQGLYAGWGRVGQIPLPFVKTPFNIAKQVLIRTPGIGYMIDLANLKNMTHAERIDAVSRHATAAMVLGGLYALVGDDMLSGSGPLDPEARELKRQTGWQPYSIRMGDKWVSYQRLEPASSLLGMLADMKEGEKQGDFERFGSFAQRALSTVAENITNKTFLAGLENLSNAFSDPLRYGGEWLKRTESSLVPNTIGFVPYGHLAQTLDPTYREVGIDPVKVFMSKTPGLSRMLEPQYTPTGEIRKRPEVFGGPRWFSPIAESVVRTDPVAKAAGLLSQINYPMRRVRPTIDYKGITVQLEPEEQRRLAQAQNEAMKLIGQRLLNDPNFQALPDNEDLADYPGQRTKHDVVARIMRRYRKPVMNQLKPLLRERAAKFLKEEGQQRMASAGGP